MTARIEVRRTQDGELVGFIEPSGDLFVPATVFGHPLGDPCDVYEAEQLVHERGMVVLAERWLLTLDGREQPIAVQIVEASPSSVVVQNVDFGYEGDFGERFTIAVPVGDRLRLA